MKSAVVVISVLMSFSCQRASEPSSPPDPQMVSSDDQLFALVNRGRTSPGFDLFPHVDSVVAGSLNGSSAHQPMVRVGLNLAALKALPDGRATEGLSFPDGSIILKEIRMNGGTSLFAVLYKERDNPLSSGGWLWAEYKPDGTVVFSIQNKGIGCIDCHSREQGPLHDHVRTFERQYP
jgi:hypothetical protein